MLSNFVRKQGTRMRVAALALVVVSALAAVTAGALTWGAGPALAAGGEGREVRLRVTGTGEVSAAPDRAVIHSVVEVSGETPQEARNRGEEIFAAVRQALAAFEGLTLVPAHYGLHPRWEYIPEQGRSEVSGYTANRQFELQVTNIEAVGEILAALLDAGVQSVYGVQFTVSESEELRRQATHAAIADARRQAEAVAEALGGSVERIVEVVVGSGDPGVVMPGMRAEMSSTFDPSPVTIRTDVTVEFVVRYPGE